MALHGLDPAFVRIHYTSAEGRHTMTLPSVPIVTDGIGVDPVLFTLRGGEAPVTVASAVTDFCNILKTHMISSEILVDYIAFTQDGPTGVPTPVKAGPLGIAGTDAATSVAPNAANQATYTWRTDLFGLFKIVILDGTAANYFRQTNKANGNITNLDAYVTADASWLAGRDGGKPQTFLGLENVPNKALRRKYGYT